MSEAIKLFGRRIPVPESQAAAEVADGCDLGPALKHDEVEKDPCQEAIVAEVTELSSDDIEELDCNDQDGVSVSNRAKDADEKEITVDGKLMCDSKPEEEQAGKVSGQEKILKKPDKILPCPRCNSLDTKFCYFNNYNVNQPRHFCKNCQRYWTAGGTMRNVPVGAGRRKNKHSSSHYRHLITVSEGMPPLRIDVPDSPHCQSSSHLNGTRTVLKFGQEAQICDSITNSLNFREQRRKCDDPTACSEIGKEPSCSPSLEIPSSLEKESLADAGQVNQNILSDPSSRLVPMHSLPCYPGPHWAFPWGPGWNDIAAAAAAAEAGRNFSAALNGEEGSIPMPWNLSPVMTSPAFVGSTIPVPLVPASFWGCMASWLPAAWNIPFMGLSGCQSLSSSNNTNACATIHSPRLGKHSRDAAIPQGEERVEKSLWVPKTLRIDDPEEAAKSSIWATLGIKHDRNEPFAKGGIFKTFQPQATEKPLPPDATHVMQANPAALCRSRTFQESS